MLLISELKSLVMQHGILAVVDALSGISGQISEERGPTAANAWIDVERILEAASSAILDVEGL